MHTNNKQKKATTKEKMKERKSVGRQRSLSVKEHLKDYKATTTI